MANIGKLVQALYTNILFYILMVLMVRHSKVGWNFGLYVEFTEPKGAKRASMEDELQLGTVID